MSRPPGIPRLERDRLTLTLYAPFMTWGWFLYGFSPAVPLIADEQGISRGLAGLHGTAMACGTILTGLVSSRLARRFGRRTMSLTGSAFLVTGIGLLLSGSRLPETLAACFVTAIGGNLTISSALPALSLHQGPAGPAAVTEANAMGAAVGLLAPIALGTAVGLGWGWRPAVGLVAVLAVAAGLVMASLPASGPLGRGAVARSTLGTAATGRTARAFSSAFWFFWVALVCGVGIEFATTFWASDLIAQRTDAPGSVAAASVSALVIGMSVSRFVVGPLSRHKAPEKLLLVGFAVAAAGWLLFWVATSPVLAIAGLVLAGLGYGTHFPMAISLVIRASDGRPDQAQGRASLGIGGAVGSAPFLLGALADSFGAHTAFLLVPLLIAVGGTATALGLRSVHRALAVDRAPAA